MTIERTARQGDGRHGGILARLARDRRGNTLAIMAIALIPITGLAGSAIDTARMYYVKVRLQQACDAGVLAGRKFMTGTTFDDRARLQAEAFFRNNFQAGMMGSETPAFLPVRTADNQVAGTANVVVPMTLTKMMGMAPVALSVTCEAKLEIPNLDIMFVLDTTGSMGDTNSGDSVNKITALRTAVVNFYDTMERVRQTGTQIRYGVVPYSANVNVGMLLRPEWLADRGTYQSRFPDGTTESARVTVDNADYVYTRSAWAEAGGSRTTSTSAGSAENCVAPGSDMTTVPDDPAWTSGNPETRVVTEVRNGASYSAVLSNGTCTITKDSYTDYRRTRNETRRPNPNKGKRTEVPVTTYWWRYRPVEYDITALKGSGTTASGGRISAQVANEHKWRQIDWTADNACIEERKTVRQTLFPTIPGDAYDLDIDRIPDPGDADTQWTPALPALIYDRTGLNGWTIDPVTSDRNVTAIADRGATYAPCPSPAMRLTTLSRDEMTNYVNTMRVGGATYHDIGFLWGTRLISPTGLFAADNARAADGGEISRHIIFMTDGQTATARNIYDAYGLSVIDRRRTDGLPTDALQDQIVGNRLTALCGAARRRGITVWVIAFGTSLNAMLRTCSSDGRAFQTANAPQLNNAFTNIAAQIAKLRISN